MHRQVADTTVYAGCSVVDPGSAMSTELVSNGAATIAFGDLLYRITAMNSGRHRHEGTLWIRNGAHEVRKAPVPLAAIADDPRVLWHRDSEHYAERSAAGVTAVPEKLMNVAVIPIYRVQRAKEA